MWKQIYIDARYAKAAEKVGASNTPIYRLIERLYGEKLVTVRQEVGATPITAAVAAVLAVEAGSPGLLIEREYVSESGRVFEVTRSIYPAGRFRYTQRVAPRAEHVTWATTLTSPPSSPSLTRRSR